MAIKGYWKLNGNSNDYSGNGNNGTDTSITYSQANGRLGQGAGFNGSTSRIVINNNLGLTKDGDKTMSIWVKLSANLSGANAYVNIFYVNIGTISFSLGYYRESNINSFAFERSRNNISSESVRFNNPTAANGWYMLTLTFSSNNLKAYVNGVYLGEINTSSLEGQSTSIITSFGYINVNWKLNGNIDEAIADNTAWSAARVKNEYARVKGFF